MRQKSSPQWKIARTLSMSLLLSIIALMPTGSPFAQNSKEGPVQITGVSSKKTGDNTVVTVSADAPLKRTQTWQDEEGFHLTLPGASPGSLKGLPRGVIVRNLGRSLEVVVPVKPGTGVTVDPHFNQLNLIVNGSVDTSRGEAQVEPQPRRQRAEESVEGPAGAYPPAVRQPRERRVDAASIDPLKGPDYTASSPIPSGAPAKGAEPSAIAAQPAVTETNNVAPANPNPETPQNNAPPARPAPAPDTESGGIFSYLFSMTGALVLLLVGLALFWLVRRRRNNDGFEDVEERSAEPAAEEIVVALEERPRKERRRRSRRASDHLSETNTNLELAPRFEGEAIEKRSVAPVQPALFGAYRVDQEVGKLVLGQAHRLDVLSSRAPDDRIAIETSLLKVLDSQEYGEDERRKALEAMEEYGFVARHCASLLLANNAYDRASSARVLGKVSSQASLPFLLEALYDQQEIVRTEAVSCLGALKMPMAIGALLDMARRHPEIPSNLLSQALNSCSFESLDFFDVPMQDPLLLEAGSDSPYSGEITHLGPAAAIEDLPEWFEDEELSEALARLQETDMEARSAAVRRLGQFHVQRSVGALTSIAANDPEPMVRAAAVTSLSEIEHESVFAPIIMAFGDEAREVRAAAARSLSRMSFDRAEAYVRLIETSDEETLKKVAQSCIKAGMVTQAFARLISEDRRLAYEAFSLLSLLAKAQETEPLVDAISNHPETSVRLAVVRLLGTSNQPEVATIMRHLAVRDGLPDKVRTTLLEYVYQIDQAEEVRS